MKKIFVGSLALVTLATGCGQANVDAAPAARRNAETVGTQEIVEKSKAVVAAREALWATNADAALVVDELIKLDATRIVSDLLAHSINGELNRPHLGGFYLPRGFGKSVAGGVRVLGVSSFGMGVLAAVPVLPLGLVPAVFVGSIVGTVTAIELAPLVATGAAVSFAYVNIDAAFKFNKSVKTLDSLLEQENAQMLKVRSILSALSKEQREDVEKGYSSLVEAAGMSPKAVRTAATVEIQKSFL